MSKEQRRRALSNAGKRPRSRVATSGDAHEGVATSCNQTVAANSENSAQEPNANSGTPSLEGYGWYQEYVELSARFAWRLPAYIAWAASPVQDLRKTRQAKNTGPDLREVGNRSFSE